MRERRSRAHVLAKGETGRGSHSSGGDRGFKKGHGRGDLGGGLAGGGCQTKEEQGGSSGVHGESRGVQHARHRRRRAAVGMAPA
jgi:hypothetical protein